MRKRILITGAGGFIGRHVVSALNGEGHDVHGISSRAVPGILVWPVDLLDVEATRRIFDEGGPFDVVIHLAALAHGQKPPRNETCFSANLGMTQNLLTVLAGQQPHFILFSSVAVYGEEGRPQPVQVTADPRPATEYGRSKVACELLALSSELRDVDILRLAPVFEETQLREVRKRVFLPRLPVRVRWQPPPTYSLCHVRTVTQVIERLIQRGPAGRWVHQVADPRAYRQNELVSWFSGPVVSLPVLAARPFYWLLRLVPGPAGYALRCLYWKLICSNRYEPGCSDLVKPFAESSLAAAPAS